MGFSTPLKYKTAGKKRSRANVPHADPGPETKIYWPISTSTNPANDTTFATVAMHPRCWGTLATDYDAAGKMYPYHLKQLVWPNQGTSLNERIGSSINAKLIRIKGCLDVYSILASPIRIRMYYIYYKNHSVINQLGVSYLKKYTDDLVVTGNPNTERTHAHDNYYHGCWKDVWLNEPDFFKTKLLEFYIKPVTGFEIPGNAITAQTAYNVVASAGDIAGMPAFSLMREFQVANVRDELVNSIPVDKTIYLNQSVNCTQDSHYLYVEADDVTALANTTAGNYGDVPSPVQQQGNVVTPFTSFNVGREITCADTSYEFKFKLFYYYTDD